MEILFDRLISPGILQHLKRFPCVALLGPRQTGKTTLVKMLNDQYDRESVYLDLESDEDIAKLSNAELYFNEREDKLIILDEIQRNPKLLVLIRSVIDKKESKRQVSAIRFGFTGFIGKKFRNPGRTNCLSRIASFFYMKRLRVTTILISCGYGEVSPIPCYSLQMKTAILLGNNLFKPMLRGNLQFWGCRLHPSS